MNCLSYLVVEIEIEQKYANNIIVLLIFKIWQNKLITNVLIYLFEIAME